MQLLFRLASEWKSKLTSVGRDANNIKSILFHGSGSSRRFVINFSILDKESTNSASSAFNIYAMVSKYNTMKNVKKTFNLMTKQDYPAD